MTFDASKTLAALRRGDLAGASELRLPGLREFPTEIFGLSDTLEVLDIGDGELTDLPADFGRLRKLRVLFCSNNRFTRLPPALGACESLSQVGFRRCQLEDVPAESLPPRLRWLTLTDNRISALPETLGERAFLQKLMLSGNRLTALPRSLAGASRLELIRLSSNRLESLPGWLPELPRLAWASWSGNNLDGGRDETFSVNDPRPIFWREIEIGENLGEGASGRVHRALWRDEALARTLPVAVKLFKGAMTSDGLPDSEISACLAAGAHANLIGAYGRIDDHPSGAPALLTPLVPDGWRVLAGPPSFETCSRDVYASDCVLTPACVLRLAYGIASAMAHLHESGVSHGDLYAHNILWDGAQGSAVLTDFGAASRLPADGQGETWRRVESRAFGILLEELLDRCDLPGTLAPLRELASACAQPRPAARPTVVEAMKQLEEQTPPVATGPCG